jgi:hypothetical protein
MTKSVLTSFSSKKNIKLGELAFFASPIQGSFLRMGFVTPGRIAA